jgi:hypothetical protein
VGPGERATERRRETIGALVQLRLASSTKAPNVKRPPEPSLNRRGGQTLAFAGDRVAHLADLRQLAHRDASAS